MRDEIEWLQSQLRKANDMIDRARHDLRDVLDANDEDRQAYEAVILTLALDGLEHRRDELLTRIGAAELEMEQLEAIEQFRRDLATKNRDKVIREALAELQVSVATVMTETGLSRARVYQIRDGK